MKIMVASRLGDGSLRMESVHVGEGVQGGE